MSIAESRVILIYLYVPLEADVLSVCHTEFVVRWSPESSRRDFGEIFRCLYSGEMVLSDIKGPSAK